MYSYTPILKKWLEAVAPAKAWEWGPGRSTRAILEALGADGELVSIEHSPRWKAAIEAEISDPRWSLQLVPAADRASRYAYSICEAPGRQDLIFIDGRRRVECAIAAMQRVSPEGVIILHDASREVYVNLLAPLIETLETALDTIVFRPK